MYELQEYKTQGLHVYYYFLIDCDREVASTFRTHNDHVSELLDSSFIRMFKRYKSIGTISKSQLNMYLTIKPNMTIKDLIEILSGVPPVLS